MTLSDLAKYSMIRSIARSLCDSWASCYPRACTSTGWTYRLCAKPLYLLPGDKAGEV